MAITPILARADGDKLKQLQALHIADYSDTVDLKKFDERSPYVKIDDINLDDTERRVLYVRKDQLTSLYMERRTKLSSDRRKRVKQQPQCSRIHDHSASDEHETPVMGLALLFGLAAVDNHEAIH